MVEKEFKVGHTSIVPYVNIEPYYDSRYAIVNHVRLIGREASRGHGRRATRWRGT